MRAQAPENARVIWHAGTAEAIPLPDGVAQGVIVVLAMHHFSSLKTAGAEMRRICPNGPVVALTVDPRQSQPLWFHEYFPTIHQRDFEMFPPLGAVIDELVAPDWTVKTNPFLLPSDLADINMYAGWNRPEMYLDADFRRAMSGFALADPAIVEPALKRLAEDLESGAWDRANGALRQRDSFDAGYHFIRWTAPLR